MAYHPYHFVGEVLLHPVYIYTVAYILRLILTGINSLFPISFNIYRVLIVMNCIGSIFNFS